MALARITTAATAATRKAPALLPTGPRDEYAPRTSGAAKNVTTQLCDTMS